MMTGDRRVSLRGVCTTRLHALLLSFRFVALVTVVGDAGAAGGGQNHESGLWWSSRRQRCRAAQQLAWMQADADGNLPLWESEES